MSTAELKNIKEAMANSAWIEAMQDKLHQFDRLQDSSFELTSLSDADNAGCIDSRKSTSGGIQFVGDKLISWMSKKQNCTAMSSAKAEYVATEYQLVNMFTKALPEDRFKYLVRRIEDGNPSKANIKQALGRSYALSWKPCQGDSLNLPDHRTRRWCCSLIPAKSNSSPHVHAQTTNTYKASRFKNKDNLNLKTKSSTNSDIQDLPQDFKSIKGDCS
nr:uncharacterized mitochondrial protein AtMg00810-like [Tanacetum cinerariifolium]